MPDHSKTYLSKDSGISLRIHQMSCWTYSHRLIVRHLDVLLRKGESLLIMGPSGVGKSTFLLALMDLYEDYEGDIEFQPPDSVMMLPQAS